MAQLCFSPPGAKGGYQASSASPAASAGSATPNTGALAAPVNSNPSNNAEWDYALGGRGYGSPTPAASTDQVGSATNPNAPVYPTYNGGSHWGNPLQDRYMAAANQYRQQLGAPPPPNPITLNAPKTPILLTPGASSPNSGDGTATALPNPTTDGKMAAASSAPSGMGTGMGNIAPMQQSFIPATNNGLFTPSTADLAPAAAPSAYRLPVIPQAVGSAMPSTNPVVNALMKRFQPDQWR